MIFKLLNRMAAVLFVTIAFPASCFLCINKINNKLIRFCVIWQIRDSIFSSACDVCVNNFPKSTFKERHHHVGDIPLRSDIIMSVIYL